MQSHLNYIRSAFLFFCECTFDKFSILPQKRDLYVSFSTTVDVL